MILREKKFVFVLRIKPKALNFVLHILFIFIVYVLNVSNKTLKKVFLKGNYI